MEIQSHYVTLNSTITNRKDSMKKNYLKIIGMSLVSLLILTSCSFLEILGSILDSAVASNNSSEVNSFNTENYEYDSSLNDVELVIEEGKAGHNNKLSDYASKNDYTIFPSIGTQNLLVIPVYFKDFLPENMFTESREEARENIYNAFFGDDVKSSSENKTGWESVSSYYKKSSYGKLVISGEVTDWCPISQTLLSAATNRSTSNPSNAVLREAIKWYKSNYPGEISKYDNDGDGYIDGVALVYANPSQSDYDYAKYARTTSNLEAINDFCWAYTTWDNASTSLIGGPVGNVYMFASYSFLWEGEYYENNSIINFNRKKLVDSHTLVHEFGHMLGLDDYYSYDENDSSAPLGRLDMMDYNIGGHNPYSKYLLGWIEPRLITKEGLYDLDSFVETGDVLLIPASLDDFSYSAFDEYLLVEFYTPTGNNEFDAKNKYCGYGSSYPYFFSQYGIRLLHVDSRLIVFNNMTKKYSFSKTLNVNSIQDVTIAASNTPSYSIVSSYKLISLISNRGIKDYYKTKKYATNDDLFGVADSYKGLHFDNGKELEYELIVNSIDKNTMKASISIEKIK